MTFERAFLVLCGLAVALSALPARADSDCPACRTEDEVQVGEARSPPIPQPDPATPTDPRGKAVDIPVPGVPTVYNRPGAGLWVGEVGQGNNVFVKPRQSSVTLGVLRDF
jgi:hypothetical protein